MEKQIQDVALKPVGMWYHDKRFFFYWCLHALIIYIAVLYLFEPILRRIILNGGLTYHLWISPPFVLAYLLPFWLFQLLALSVYPEATKRARWVVVFTTYLWGIGACAVFAKVGSAQVWPHTSKKWLLVLKSVAFFILFYFLFPVVMTVIADITSKLVLFFVKH